MVYTVVNQDTHEEDAQSKKRYDSSSSRKQETVVGEGFWNLELELQAVKTMLTPDSEWAARVYAASKPDLFYHVATKAIFSRLQKIMEKSKSFELPSLDFILSDAKITPTVRQTFKDAIDGTDGGDPITVVKNQGDFDLLFQSLNSLAKTRVIFNATKKAANELLESDEPSEFAKKVADKLGESLFSIEDEDDMISHVTMGVGYNQAAEDCFSRLVNGVFEEQKIRTGYEEFDTKTGGFHRTNLVVIAGGSGSGKSLLAVNLLVRQFLLGYKVILASYEMTDDEVMLRLLSNISEVEMSKIQNKQMTPNDDKRLHIAWREFNLKGYEKGASYHVICPKKEQTVPEVGFKVRNLKPDVLILDYINLLASTSGDETAQWQSLGDIAREAKLLANKLNCVVILLAQLDDAYNLRYSKGIKDHANFVMGFLRDDAAKSSQEILIKQIKARNAPLYDFKLREEFCVAQFRDMEQDNRLDWPSEDDLLMLELRCQSVGLKLEPTASKEFDKNKMMEAKRVVVNNDDEITLIEADEEDEETQDADGGDKEPSTSLLFSADDAIPTDFSKIKVKESSTSLLRNNDALFYGDDLV